MDKISLIDKEIKELERQKEEALKIIKQADGEINIKYSEIAQAYEDFYRGKINKEFVYIEDYPKMEALDLYLSRISKEFPLMENGIFNIKELAEMIKHLFQFKTGKEFQILTIGAVELDGSPVYGGQVYSSKPHLYFLIGNENTLKQFKEYDGKFVNSNHLYADIFLEARGQNIIVIEAQMKYPDTLGIECLTNNESDRQGLINYYNDCYCQYKTYEVSDKKQIFSYNLRSHLNYSGGYKIKGIKDVIDFSIHPFDSFIAKTLISTSIYKRNNGIKDLNGDDYNHIFDVLCGEKVDIVGDANKDIPKSLIYVPNEETNR